MRTYLGDAVYATFDGYMLTLTTENGIDITNTIHLEPGVLLAPWATPVATELGNTLENYMAMKAKMRSGPRHAITHPSLQALTAIGPSSTLSTAPTEKRGALNPAHSRWLMGFPGAWDDCGVTAMLSCRKSRRPS